MKKQEFQTVNVVFKSVSYLKINRELKIKFPIYFAAPHTFYVSFLLIGALIVASNYFYCSVHSLLLLAVLQVLTTAVNFKI